MCSSYIEIAYLQPQPFLVIYSKKSLSPVVLPIIHTNKFPSPSLRARLQITTTELVALGLSNPSVSEIDFTAEWERQTQSECGAQNFLCFSIFGFFSKSSRVDQNSAWFPHTLPSSTHTDARSIK